MISQRVEEAGIVGQVLYPHSLLRMVRLLLFLEQRKEPLLGRVQLSNELRPVGIECDLLDPFFADQLEQLRVSNVLDVAPRSFSE